MAKGQQRSGKEAKKPKQDKSPPKPITSAAGGAVMPTVTTQVVPKGKLKKLG